METKNQVVNSKLVKYFEETSKHLFVRNGNFVKTLLVKDKEQKDFVVILEFNPDKCSIEIKPINYWEDSTVKNLISMDRISSAYNYQRYLWKNTTIFPDYKGEVKSIKNFKFMREKIAEVEKIINGKENIHVFANKENIQNEISKILKDLVFLK